MGIKLKNYVDIDALFTQEEVYEMFEQAGYQKKYHIIEKDNLKIEPEVAAGKPLKNTFTIKVKIHDIEQTNNQHNYESSGMFDLHVESAL